MTAEGTVNMPLRAALLVAAIAIGEAMRAEISAPGTLGSGSLIANIGPVVMYAMLHAAVLGWFAARSACPVWRLFGAMFLALFGIQGVLPFVEVLFFDDALPFKPADIEFMVVAALPPSAVAAAAAAALFGNLYARNEASASPKRAFGAWSWIWRLAAVGLAYAVLYFAAGILVVYAQDYAREFYKDVAGAMNPLALLVFQIGRGIVWALMALPLLASQSTSVWERSNALGAAFAVFVGALLLGENPYMPGQMRMLHLVEIGISNFLFGLAAGYLLTRLVRR
jgi:hypothetical protein